MPPNNARVVPSEERERRIVPLFIKETQSSTRFAVFVRVLLEASRHPYIFDRFQPESDRLQETHGDFKKMTQSQAFRSSFMNTTL